MFLSIGAAVRACTPAIDSQASVEPVPASISRRVMDTSSAESETLESNTSLNEIMSSRTWVRPWRGSAGRPRYTARMHLRLLCILLLSWRVNGLDVARLSARAEPDWSRFRGPNGSGISTATNVPTEFGPQKNLLWRLPLPRRALVADPLQAIAST